MYQFTPQKGDLVTIEVQELSKTPQKSWNAIGVHHLVIREIASNGDFHVKLGDELLIGNGKTGIIHRPVLPFNKQYVIKGVKSGTSV